ncbi:hypothetical protein [Micromonospora palythoicola]|uniref:hypothetical protein n=1 Tax=Micromonospora palythoicola TaxID=3120507 RepID=UPI002FCE5276
MRQTVKVHHGRAVLDPAELRLGDAQPVRYGDLRQWVPTVVRVMPVRPDHPPEMSLRQRVTYRLVLPE